MLTVEVKLASANGRHQVLGTMKIVNDRTGSPFLGNYRVEATEEGEAHRKARVEGFPRLDRGPWELVARALGALLGAEPRGKRMRSVPSSLVVLAACGRCGRQGEVHLGPGEEQGRCAGCGSGVVLVRWPDCAAECPRSGRNKTVSPAV